MFNEIISKAQCFLLRGPCFLGPVAKGCCLAQMFDMTFSSWNPISSVPNFSPVDQTVQAPLTITDIVVKKLSTGFACFYL